MKERLITAIQLSMSTALSSSQMNDLKEALDKCFQEVEITKRKQTSFNDVSRNQDLLKVFVDSKKIEGCSRKSLDYYYATICRMLTEINKPLQEICTDDLRSYLMNYQETRNSSKVTIDNMRRIFSSFFGWLEDEEYVFRSPVRRIKKIKTDKPIKETFTDEGLELLRNECKEIRDLAIVDLLASTGMRVGELVNLNKEDVNFHERECLVLGKGNNERIVYFDARTKIHLLNYLDSRKDNNSALFVSLANPYCRLMIGGVETRLRQLGERACVNKVHPHKFRRTLATRAIDKGMPIEQVQRLLGHVKIDTTMHYAMVNQANVKNSHRKYVG